MIARPKQFKVCVIYLQSMHKPLPPKNPQNKQKNKKNKKNTQQHSNNNSIR